MTVRNGMDKPLLTDEEYLEEGGTKCPVCQSTEVETIDSIEADGSIAWQHVKCSSCGAIWQDNYKLVGYLLISGG